MWLTIAATLVMCYIASVLLCAQEMLCVQYNIEYNIVIEYNSVFNQKDDEYLRLIFYAGIGKIIYIYLLCNIYYAGIGKNYC